MIGVSWYNNEKEYLVSKPMLMTKIVNLTIRPSNLKQLVSAAAASPSLQQQDLPPNRWPQLVEQVCLQAGNEKVTGYRSKIEYQYPELSQHVRAWGETIHESMYGGGWEATDFDFTCELPLQIFDPIDEDLVSDEQGSRCDQCTSPPV